MFEPVNNVHEGFSDGNLPDGGHVKSVHVVPPVDLVILDNFGSILYILTTKKF